MKGVLNTLECCGSGTLGSIWPRLRCPAIPRRIAPRNVIGALKQMRGGLKASPSSENLYKVRFRLLQSVVGIGCGGSLVVADDAGFVHEEMARSRGSRDRVCVHRKIRRRRAGNC